MRGRADDAGPDEPLYGPSKLEEKILFLLEEAGAPQELNDKISKLIEEWELSQMSEDIGEYYEES